VWSFERIPVTLLTDGMTGSTWSQRLCPPPSAYQHGRQTKKCRLFSSHLIRNYGLLEYDALYFHMRVTKFRTNLTASHIQATRAKADGGKAIGYVGLRLNKVHDVISRTTAILTLTALSASYRTNKSRTLKKKYLQGELQLHAFLISTPDRTEDTLSHPSSFTMGGTKGRQPVVVMAGCDVLGKRNISYPQHGIEPRFRGHTTSGAVIMPTIIIFTLRTAAFKAYCAIWVRRSNFRHQASPRVSPRESTQRRKVEIVGEKCPVILPK
jgi:hypothetical protein